MIQQALHGSATQYPATAMNYCDLVEAWAYGLGRKQRLSFGTLQTKALLLLVQLNLARPPDELWTDAGALLRSAITMGLHRDPSESPGIRIFHGELRRRLWATIVELELQMAFLCGVSPMICKSDYNTRPPLNVHDDALSEDMTQVATQHSLNQRTETLMQTLLANTLPQRLDAVYLAGDLHYGTGAEEIFRRARELESFLEDLPPFFKHDYQNPHQREDLGTTYGRLLFDIYVRNALLCLYRPYILTITSSPYTVEARDGCIRSCLVILNYQTSFDPLIVGTSFSNAQRYWDLMHMTYRFDIMQSVCSVCLEYRTLVRAAQNSRVISGAGYTPAATPQDNGTTPHVQYQVELLRIAERTLDTLMRRIGRYGSDAKDALCVAIILESVKTDDPQHMERLMTDAVQRFPQALQPPVVADKIYIRHDIK